MGVAAGHRIRHRALGCANPTSSPARGPPLLGIQCSPAWSLNSVGLDYALAPDEVWQGRKKECLGHLVGFGPGNWNGRPCHSPKTGNPGRVAGLGWGRERPLEYLRSVQLYATPPPVLLESEFLWWSSLGFLRNMHTNPYQCVAFTTRAEFTYPSPTDTLQNAVPVRKSPLGHFRHNVATVPATNVASWAPELNQRTRRQCVMCCLSTWLDLKGWLNLGVRLKEWAGFR